MFGFVHLETAQAVAIYGGNWARLCISSNMSAKASLFQLKLSLSEPTNTLDYTLYKHVFALTSLGTIQI